ncbi:helix-turn-helix transcriptional regulator [Moritella yayanosii]|uniref:Putative transcriptional regulator n=1 Tax=Moritella yayanosii TaxID=69539 RepID=A0A330LSF8_9GAMM|nr:AlpA family phage regulatory protein [Moritella yayanosii]SQD79599.1 putative transcriptional regulator [Moritella yayanosii]
MRKLFDPERIIREVDRRYITSISRTKAWQLEKEGLFPKRIRLGNRSVGWKLSELLEWVENQPRV